MPASSCPPLPVARSLVGLAMLLLAASLLGCGAIRSTVVIVEAEKSLRAAQDAGTAQTAPYPTALAEQLLREAREELGAADYSRSFALAKEARTQAETALVAGRGTKLTPPAPPASAPVDPAPASPVDPAPAPASTDPAPPASTDPAPPASTEPAPPARAAPAEDPAP